VVAAFLGIFPLLHNDDDPICVLRWKVRDPNDRKADGDRDWHTWLVLQRIKVLHPTSLRGDGDADAVARAHDGKLRKSGRPSVSLAKVEQQRRTTDACAALASFAMHNHHVFLVPAEILLRVPAESFCCGSNLQLE
jgi:hypothetical protein